MSTKMLFAAVLAMLSMGIGAATAQSRSSQTGLTVPQGASVEKVTIATVADEAAAEIAAINASANETETERNAAKAAAKAAAEKAEADRLAAEAGAGQG